MVLSFCYLKVKEQNHGLEIMKCNETVQKSIIQLLGT